jgi:hypothetical protein
MLQPEVSVWMSDLADLARSLRRNWKALTKEKFLNMNELCGHYQVPLSANRIWRTAHISFIIIIIIIIKSSACCITVSNTTCCCNHTNLLLVFIYVCLLEWFNFSSSIEFTYLVNCFKYLLVSSLLHTYLACVLKHALTCLAFRSAVG